jgi:hypothetical protein
MIEESRLVEKWKPALDLVKKQMNKLSKDVFRNGQPPPTTRVYVSVTISQGVKG